MKVEPIRDKDTIQNILQYLKSTNKRNYIMFMIGIYTGLRIGDILRLKIKDVKNKQGLRIKMQKVSKDIEIAFNPILKRSLDEYCADKEPNEFLIKSIEGYNKAIDKSQAYRIIKDIGEKFKLDNIGTHSLRKTFGYHYYYSTDKDIVAVQLALGHRDSSTTLRYIGVLQSNINASLKRLRY
ncbi:tyrosine-type recombinase/integrase [Clostridium felsineum]|uniref:tyrosine-type recombinase/integrase n=1 Tax=Clostridium felsineum TaxID=36839 RepID=UPI00098C9653|nr:tyrosine-type recombinase/integrase [Clostridium felsineum]URZ02730.1 Tyrosine recombinase XerC [Clostridium felsineum]